MGPNIISTIGGGERMLNWADLSSLLILFAGVLCGILGARAEEAGVAASILTAVLGLLLGTGMSYASSMLAYKILGSKRMAGGGGYALYLLIPWCFLVIVIAVTIPVTVWLAHHI